LRAKLDDQMRMVTALRSAARKRDMLEQRKSYATTASEDTARPVTSDGAPHDTVPDLDTLPFNRQSSSRASRHSMPRSVNGRTSLDGHRSNPSTASRSSSVINFSKPPLSPIAILSPGHSSSNSRESLGQDTFRATKSRRKSVDEMTQLLDQMIQKQVEGGHVVRGDRGSLRVRHDTMLDQINDQEETQSEHGASNENASVASPAQAEAGATTW